MLCLKRRVDESIMVGDADIMVQRISGDTVTLGIKAPKHIKVHRKEVYEDIARNGLRPPADDGYVPRGG